MTQGLCARGIARQYGSKWAVREVNLEVRAGEVVGLLGPNGAGKTTTFNIVVGRVRPSSGQVFLGADEITDLPMYQRARRGITYLPQEASVFRKLSVEQNVMAILETLPLTRAARRERAGQLLRELGLETKAGQRAVTLSGGERRRVEIARALVLDPQFILLDEPFAGIDPIAVLELQKLVAVLAGRGIGVVITDHKVRETLAICDRAYIIQDGQILREGTPQAISEDPAVREIYLGENFQL